MVQRESRRTAKTKFLYGNSIGIERKAELASLRRQAWLSPSNESARGERCGVHAYCSDWLKQPGKHVISLIFSNAPVRVALYA